jgi:hypothetical protein
MNFGGEEFLLDVPLEIAGDLVGVGATVDNGLAHVLIVPLECSACRFGPGYHE